MWRPLSDTLLSLIGAVSGEGTPGLVITEADIDIPLELSATVHRGQLVILGSAPHSRWKAGFLPQTHPTRLSIRLLDE